MHYLSNSYPYLTKRDLEKIDDIAIYKRLKKKEVFISPFDETPKVAFTISGMIRGYFINDRGEEKTIFLSEEGYFTGTPESTMSNVPTKYTFEAATEAEILLFDRTKLFGLAVSNPGIASMVMDSLTRIIAIMSSRIESQIDKLPESRYDELIEHRPHFFQKVHHKDVANFLGISPVSLSRIIRRKVSPNVA